MLFTIFKEKSIPMPLCKDANNGTNIVLSLQWSIEMSLPFQLFTLPIEVMNPTTIWLTSLKKAIPMQPYYLSFRVVRFKLTEDSYEVLLTNLSEDEFSVVDLKELYAMRWGIETSFRDLKYSLALSYFHSKKTENIPQEVFARLTMHNFAELITSHVVVKQKSRKHLYKINFAAAVHICRNFFLKNISPSDVKALLLMHLLPVRHWSANLRRGSPRAAPSFTYRIP